MNGKVHPRLTAGPWGSESSHALPNPPAEGITSPTPSSASVFRPACSPKSQPHYVLPLRGTQRGIPAQGEIEGVAHCAPWRALWVLV